MVDLAIVALIILVYAGCAYRIRRLERAERALYTRKWVREFIVRLNAAIDDGNKLRGGGE